MVKRQMHNLRQRYRLLLRDEVAHIVQDPADVNDEIRYLSPCWQRVINLIPHVRRSHRWHFPAEEHEPRNGRA
jgi:hypothetical protein